MSAKCQKQTSVFAEAKFFVPKSHSRPADHGNKLGRQITRTSHWRGSSDAKAPLDLACVTTCLHAQEP
jgi:hypothetical protein